MTSKCSATVYDSTGWSHSYPCSRNGKIEEDSKWWCKQHAPSSVKARSEASSTRWQADEADRLRAVNARLLAELEDLAAYGLTLQNGTTENCIMGLIIENLARAAIEEARK